MKIQNDVRGKLILVETVILAIPLFILSYFLCQSDYTFEYSHLILFAMLILLVLAGLIVVRQIFNGIYAIAASLNKAEAGDMIMLDMKKDIAEFHGISVSVNNLVRKLEEATAELKQKSLEITAIKEITEETKKISDIDELFNVLLDKSMSVTGARIGSVLVIEDVFSNINLLKVSKQTEPALDDMAFYNFRIVAARGHAQKIEGNSLMSAGSYIAKHVLRSRKSLLIQDIEKDERTLKINDPRYGSPSFLSMPVFSGNKLVAVLNLSNKATGQIFDGNDEQVISIMVDEFNLALENSMMHSSMKEHVRRIKQHNIELEKEIEAHKRVENALYSSENKYRELCEFLPIGVYEVDREGNIGMVNQVFLETLGYTQDDIDKGLNVLQMVIKEDMDRVKENMQKVLDGGRTSGSEYTVSRKDGSTVPVTSFSSPIIFRNIVVGIRGAILDITKRKQAEASLRESEAKYRLLAEKMTDVVWIMDLNLRTIYVSPSIEKMLGFTPEERMLQDVKGQLTPASLALSYDVLSRELLLEQNTQADPERTITMEVEYYHKDGSTRWAENIICGLRDNNGVLIELHGVSRDITQRKKMEMEQQETSDLPLKS